MGRPHSRTAEASTRIDTNDAERIGRHPTSEAAASAPAVAPGRTRGVFIGMVPAVGPHHPARDQASTAGKPFEGVEKSGERTGGRHRVVVHQPDQVGAGGERPVDADGEPTGPTGVAVKRDQRATGWARRNSAVPSSEALSTTITTSGRRV